MISLDTNVVVRLVTRDDPEQAEAAIALFRSGELWIGKTVLVEIEWVLRYSYGLSRDAIAETFTRLLGYRRLEVEDRSVVLRALGWFRQGLDFADALHLASGPDAERFATFDRTLARVARASKGHARSKSSEPGLDPVGSQMGIPLLARDRAAQAARV